MFNQLEYSILFSAELYRMMMKGRCFEFADVKMGRKVNGRRLQRSMEEDVRGSRLSIKLS